MNRVSTFLGSLAVIAIAVVFVTSFGPGGGGPSVKTDPTCAVEVLGNCVKSSHYRATMQLMGQLIDSDTAKKIDLQQKAMDGLIERELLLIEAKKLGLSVSETEVSRELKAGRFRFSVPAALPIEYRRFIPSGLAYGGYVDLSQAVQDPKTKQFSEDKYKKLIGNVSGMLPQDFREFQTQELIAERMRMLILSRVQVAEGEGKAEFLGDYSTAKIAYVKLRPAFYVDRAIDFADAAVNGWAEKNAAEVDRAVAERKKELGAECREVSHIMILSKPGPQAEERKKAAKAKLEDAKKRVEAGESFADVARELSEDRGTRKAGGSLGCIVQSEMQGAMKSFGDAAFGLAKDGDLSAVIETKDGSHLIRLDKKQTGPDAETAFRKRVARELYMLAEGKRLSSEGAKEIQDAVKAGKTLDDAVKDHLAKYPEPPKPEPQKDDAKDEPKKGDAKDEPKKDDAKDEPKKDDDHGDLDHLDLEEDSIVPTVEKSKPFTAREEPFEGAMFGESVAGLVFASEAKSGELIDKQINLQGGGVAVLVLVERTNPTEEEWAAERDKYLEPRRALKRKEALAEYMKRERAKHTAEIKVTEEFKPASKTAGSASASPVEE